MEKPQQSADAVLNGLIKKAKAQAVSDDRSRAPNYGINVQHWSGHMINVTAATTDPLEAVLGKRPADR